MSVAALLSSNNTLQPSTRLRKTSLIRCRSIIIRSLSITHLFLQILAPSHPRRVGIYKRKQDKIKKTRIRPRKWSRKIIFFLFFLVAFLVEFLFSFFFSCFLDRFLGRVLVFLFSFINSHLFWSHNQQHVD